MNERIKEILSEGLKVAIAAWTAISLEPCLEQWMSAVPQLIRVLIAAVIAGLILEFFLQVLIGKPRIVIEWVDTRDHLVPLSELVANIRESTNESQPFIIKIRFPEVGVMARCAMKKLMLPEISLNVRLDRLQAHCIIENSSLIGNSENPSVVSDQDRSGLRIRLGPVPDKPVVWQSAEVRWISRSTTRGDKFTIQYDFTHPTPWRKILANFVIARTSEANHFRMSGD